MGGALSLKCCARRVNVNVTSLVSGVCVSVAAFVQAGARGIVEWVSAGETAGGRLRGAPRGILMQQCVRVSKRASGGGESLAPVPRSRFYERTRSAPRCWSECGQGGGKCGVCGERREEENNNERSSSSVSLFCIFCACRSLNLDSFNLRDTNQTNQKVIKR